MKMLLNGHRVDASALKTDERHPYELSAELVIDVDGTHIFQINNGVTGFESWYMAMLLGVSVGHENDFVCCAGTKDRYDRLILDGSEWMRFLKEYFINYPESKPGWWGMIYE
jgi:hypothetical protein